MLLFLLYGHFTGRLPVYLLSFYQLTWLSYVTLPSVLYRNPSFTAFLSSSNTSILRWAYIPLSLLYSLLTVPVAILFVLRYLTIHLVRLTHRYWAILFVLSSCTSRNITTSTWPPIKSCKRMTLNAAPPSCNPTRPVRQSSSCHGSGTRWTGG